MGLEINHKDALQFCTHIMDTYTSSMSIDQHLEDSFAAIIQYQGIDDNTETFIIEVFTGCVRYDSLITVVMDGFFVKDGRHILTSEVNTFKVICYLALFRLDEIGMAQFRRFVRCGDLQKMHKFLNFFLDEKNLLTWMKDEWSKYYDTAFIQKTILSPIRRWLPELYELIEQLKHKMDTSMMISRSSAAPTEVKPFSLTQPRPRSVPVPVAIPKLKHQPVPKSNYIAPKEVSVLSRKKELNRREAEERLLEATAEKFNCANPEMSSKAQIKMQLIIEKEKRKLDFNRSKSHSIPKGILEDNIPVKLNAATILREGKLYRKREEEELKKLENLEAGGGDSSKFNEWQDKMRMADLNAQLADIERKRLEGKLSHEEAILACMNLKEDKRKQVMEMKQEAEQMLFENRERRLKEEEVMKQLVETVLNSHAGAKEAKVKVQENKARIVQELNEESRILMQQTLEQAEEDMRQKMALIQQIRAMEATRPTRHKFVDLTEKAGHRVFSEMSIAELKERLHHMRVKEQADKEEKRDGILASKQAKNDMLMSTLETISRHRKETSKAAAIRMETKKKEHSAKRVVHNDGLSDLETRLMERRSQRRQEQKNARILPNKESMERTKTLIQVKRSGREDMWTELHQTSERAARILSEGKGRKSITTELLVANRGLIGV